MKSICVYCGSSAGNSIRFTDAARELGSMMATRGIGLVYGGGNVGLMGVIADEVLKCGGTVTGVIPHALLRKEVGHHGLTQLHVVKDMHERKAMMAELANGFIAMPGGFGTLEELFEMLTWSQLGFHDKPIGLLNVDGFYDRLIVFVQELATQGFLKGPHAALMMHEALPSALLDRLDTWDQHGTPKLLDEATARAILP
jgi:uncharacterized protein (TIGR00730 family)